MGNKPRVFQAQWVVRGYVEPSAEYYVVFTQEPTKLQLQKLKESWARRYEDYPPDDVVVDVNPVACVFSNETDFPRGVGIVVSY